MEPGLARVALTSDAAEAVRLVREALVVTEGLPDDSDGRGSALHVLGPALQMTGDLEGAREVIQGRIALARRTGDNFLVWEETANLSMVERQLGNLDRPRSFPFRPSPLTSSRRGNRSWPGR